MKRILGLDLGTGSIGWALVNEATKENEKSSIVKLGVRVNPLTVGEKADFEKGKPLSTNANRTLKRGARRNLQRYKLRRQNLIALLLKHNIISGETPLTEIGKNSTHQTLKARAKAPHEKIKLNDFARILLNINKKRGYKSSRKAKSEDEGQAIDGMAIAKELYDNNLTPGQYIHRLLQANEGKNIYIPDFYRSDLQAEFLKVWNFQKEFYPDILDDELFIALKNQGQQNSRKRFLAIKGIFTAENKGKRDKVKATHYEWRAKAIEKQLSIEEVAYVLVEINNNLNKSSGYLGAISDRSKHLYFNKKTVGEYLYNQVKKNPHKPLKNQVFYRQDYLDEFESIWEKQGGFHPQLTSELKEEIRDIVIFYQRKLKSQKGNISFCQFESWESERKDEDGNTILNKSTNQPKKRFIGQRVIPKSSPLFQEFKIWQNLNNLKFRNETTNETIVIADLDKEIRNVLFNELNFRGDLKPNDILDLLSNEIKIGRKTNWKCNYEKVEGNRTNQSLNNIYSLIVENEGFEVEWSNKSVDEIKEELRIIFSKLGIDNKVFEFDSGLNHENLEKQSSLKLWHLLYAAEDDDKIKNEDRLIYGSNNVCLRKNLTKKFGFKPEYSKLISNVGLQDDYGNLSAKAIKKVLPFLKDGHDFAKACALAGYNHSNSLTKEEQEQKQYKDRLELLPKNSLRNPVVEKILNQMINLINNVCDTYDKPDEIRIELSRELKKSAKERDATTKFINANTRANENIRKIIKKDFGFTATRNDVIRYKLYQELKENGYHTVFEESSYIPYEKLFSKDIDIEHIIPKAVLFDDSFSNKTLAYRKTNLLKGKRTAIDFINEEFQSDVEKYEARVEHLYKQGSISRGKYKKLLMPISKLPTDFIERDLRNSQYIARKAMQLLKEVFKTVTPTTGKITDALRKDWGLINIMKELNFPKYKALGLTEIEERWDIGKEKVKRIEIIKDWTKRNDHRHHAMDALTVAFTTNNHIQYINNLNAASNKTSGFYGMRDKITDKDENNKRYFISPIDNFRTEAKKAIENILVSFKTKNKVVTKNTNKTKIRNGYNHKTQLTPRGQLHKETVYGKSKRIAAKPTKLNSKFPLNQIDLIIDTTQRNLVANHLEKYENNPSIAFNSKTLKKDPLIFEGDKLSEVKCYEEFYTIRKEINPDNFKNIKSIEKVVDTKIKQLLIDRLNSFNGNAKQAFSDLDKNPIWQNKNKNIAIKRVTISGVSNVEPLHNKKDHFGRFILNKNGKKEPVDFVSTGNNHHVAIYKDPNNKLHERVVPFYEAVARVNEELPIVDKNLNKDKGWEFQFSLKQNEMFIIPNGTIEVEKLNLIEDLSYDIISPMLFRVQKISTKNYLFTHHLETQATSGDDLKNLKMLDGIKYYSFRSTEKLNEVIKVRINNLGKIVAIGEY